jgi:hypothetical protein
MTKKSKEKLNQHKSSKSAQKLKINTSLKSTPAKTFNANSPP